MKNRNEKKQDYVDSFLDQWEDRSVSFRDLRANAGIYRIVRIAGLLDQEMDQLAREFGLRSSHLQALAALRRLDPKPLSASEIARASILSSGTITVLIDRLEAKKLVLRKPHPEDRRSVLVSLTAEGRKCVDKALSQRNERLAELMDVLSRTEKDSLAEVLRKISLQMGDEA